MGPLELSLEARAGDAETVGLVLQRGAGARIGEAGARALARAGEEVFDWVAAAAPGARIRYALSPAPFAARLEIEFPAAGFAPGIFNLTSGLDLDSDDLQDLPLLIAARSVDRFGLALEPGAPVRLRLEKERADPPPGALPQAPPSAEGAAIRRAAPEDLRHFARLLAGAVPAGAVPALLRHGDRLADLAAAGEAEGVLALSRDGRIAGGLAWARGEGKIAEFHGPFLLAADGGEPLAAALVEACLADLSRSRLTGLFGLAGPWLPRAWFEPLGTLLPAAPGEAGREAVFRSLEEDPGAALWCDPLAEPFLRAAYARLGFARVLRPVRPPESGEAVLAVAFDRPARAATLRPMLAGADAPAVAAAHVALLRAEGVATLLAACDLGRAADAAWLAPLIGAGFAPRYVVPGAGSGDVLVLQHPGAGA
jgi:hypothetical protein